MTDLLYAAFGSNLSLQRFQRYLPEYDYERAELFVTMGGLYFADHAESWGGGVAFIDLDAPQLLLMRLHPVSSSQFLRLWAGENRRDTIPQGDELLESVLDGSNQSADTGVPGKYNLAHRLGERDGRSIVTIATTQTFERSMPSDSYVETIRTGLLESGVSDEAADHYLAQAMTIAP